MTLKVDVTPGSAFASEVQSALARTCPCESVTVNPVSGVVSVGTMVCGCYCSHAAGCNLLTDLVRDNRAITIYESEYSSAYLGDEDGIYWYPKTVDFSDPDTCGGTLFPPDIALAHELVHARHEQFSEAEAVRGENQVRLERCMPMRTSYGERIPDFRVGTIDGSIRPEYNCNCTLLRNGWCGLLGRILCSFRSMYCFPTRIMVATQTVSYAEGGMRYAEFRADDDDINDRIDQARKVRTRLPMAAQVDHAPPLFPNPEWQVTLEGLGLDGLYRVLVLAVQGNDVKMLTNFTFQAGPGPYLGPPAATLSTYLASSQRLAEAVAERLSQLQFDDGAGGPSSAHDGAVHFLTLRSITQTKWTAMYFYQYPATSTHWFVPKGANAARWDAIKTVYELWREIVADPVTTTV